MSIQTIGIVEKDGACINSTTAPIIPMSNDFLICEHCVADNELRAELAERGKAVAECVICKSKGGRALPASDSRVKRIFRALVRLNFSEWKYNEHLGGESLETLVLSSKAIFNLGADASVEDFEDAYLVMKDTFYPETAEEIELAGAYWDGWILEGLRDRRDASVEEVVRDSFRYNYFEVQPKLRGLIESMRADISSRLAAGGEMVRGRIGVKRRLQEKWGGWRRDLDYHYLPFSGQDIGCPPLVHAIEGRLNRPRVSVLYLASDALTAVAELRPHPGHLVSTARFRLTTNLSVANFALHDIRNFLSDHRLEVLRSILSVADVMNLPVQPDQQALYIVTQLFSDCVREAGFDAVSFKSSLGPGTNLTCFKGDAFEMVPGSERAQEVTALQYSIVDVPTARQDYDKEHLKEDSDDPLSTLLHGMVRRSTTA